MSWTNMDEIRVRPRRDSRHRRAARETEALASAWCCSFNALATAFAMREGSGGASAAGRSFSKRTSLPSGECTSTGRVLIAATTRPGGKSQVKQAVHEVHVNGLREAVGIDMTSSRP
jgi:hypothetical protein